MGISDATFYRWHQKYGGLGPSELRRLRQLEKENNKPIARIIGIPEQAEAGLRRLIASGAVT